MKIRSIAAMAGAAFALLTVVLPCQAAFKEDPVSIGLTVAVREDGSGETTKIIVENADSPEEDRILSVKEGKSTELTFEMEEPGSRTYRIYQLEGTRDRVRYDKSVYTAVVFAWTEDEGLRGTVILHRDGEMEKPAEVLFHNDEIPLPEVPVKTGDTSQTRLWSGIGLTAAAAGALLLMQIRWKRRER